VSLNAGWVGHIPAHLAPGAYNRDRRTPLRSEVPVYLPSITRVGRPVRPSADTCWKEEPST